MVSKRTVTAPVSASGNGASFDPFAADQGPAAPANTATTIVNTVTKRIARICQAPMQARTLSVLLPLA